MTARQPSVPKTMDPDMRRTFYGDASRCNLCDIGIKLFDAHQSSRRRAGASADRADAFGTTAVLRRTGPAAAHALRHRRRAAAARDERAGLSPLLGHGVEAARD